jgi:hypothetical protein
MTAADRKRVRAQFERHWPKCPDGDSCGLRSESRTALALLDAIETLESEAALLDAWARESCTGGWSTHQVTPMRQRAAVLRERALHLERGLPEWAS